MISESSRSQLTGNNLLDVDLFEIRHGLLNYWKDLHFFHCAEFLSLLVPWILQAFYVHFFVIFDHSAPIT
jgi:hypothetical protein